MAQRLVESPDRLSHDSFFPSPSWMAIRPVEKSNTIEYGDILRPHERLGRITNEQQYITSHHETNHVLIAKKRHLYMLGVSVIPYRESLGRTIFQGEFDWGDNDFAIAAAGGVCETPVGRACGFSGDTQTIRELGMNVQDTVASAAAELSSYPQEIRIIFAQILAAHRELNSDQIDRAIKIAYQEYEQGIKPSDPVFTHQQSAIALQSQFIPIMDSGNVTVISDDQGLIKWFFISGNKDENNTTCDECSITDGHRDGCNGKEQHHKNNLFPKTADIFSQKN